VDKHERAKRLLRYEIISLETGIALTRGTDSMLAKWQEEADAFTYALAVLEAVEGVEEWMPKLMWNECYDETATALQAIIDAKGA
jgi:hypothetical protein